jgi:predicted phage-related endonuclease
MSRTIGASSVASILGLSPWRSELDVWRELSTDEPYSEADGGPLLRGQLLEPGLRDWYARTVGADVTPGPTLTEPGWLVGRHGHARPDAWHPVADGIATVEIKTADYRSRHDWDHGIPAYYLAQVLWQMAAQAPGELRITGARVVGYVVDDTPRIYTVERDPRREAALLRRVESWYERHVLTGDAPMGTTAESRAAWAAIAPVTQEWTAPTDTDRELVERWRAAKAAEKAAASVRRAAEQDLAVRIGSTAGLEGLLAWSPVAGRTTVDTKRLKKLHPDIFSAVSKTGAPSRRWRDLSPQADEADASEES